MEKKKTKKERRELAIGKIKNCVLKQFMEELWGLSTETDIRNQKSSKFNTLEGFCEKIQDLSPKDIGWEFLCRLVEDDNTYGFPCMHILHFLLEKGMYAGRYQKELKGIQACFDIGKKGLADRWYRKYFVYDDIKYVFYSETAVNRRLFYIKTDNPVLFRILAEFCVYDKSADKSHEDLEARDFFFENISLLLGENEKKINSIADFSYEIFSEMEKECLKYKYNQSLLRKLYRFFAFMIEYPDGSGKSVFKETDPIDYHALKRDDLAKRTSEGCKYIFYNPLDSVPEADKWILHINGFERGTTKLKATATVYYDFMAITSPFYRKLAKEYVWRETRTNFNTKHEHFLCLRDTLNRLTEYKQKTGVPEDYITINDTSFIRLWLQNKSVALATKTQKIICFRNFVTDFEKEGKLKLEFFAVEYLKQYGNSHKNPAKAITNEDIEKLNAVMMKHAGEAVEFSYCYAIFHILIQTEFRLSQVCHLESGCILPTVNKNQFLVTTSKTSNGQQYEAVITDYTKKLIEDAEHLSASIREECIYSDNKKYLFLYKTSEKQYIPVSGSYFRQYMAQCCEEAGIEHYTPMNIRDFHMTKAEEEILRKGYSDLRLRTLSGHAHVDTTRNHYVENKLTQMVEAMYGVVIGKVDIAGNIVDQIPPDIQDNKHRVENGCGFCNQNSCVDSTTISCLMCKDFYTSCDRLPEMKRMMLVLDAQIKEGKWEHDKEDLVNKKRLIAAYIIELETRIAEKED